MRYDKWLMIVYELNGSNSPVYIQGLSKPDCLRNFAGMADDFTNVLRIEFEKIDD
jgi:hypothetical protein